MDGSMASSDGSMVHRHKHGSLPGHALPGSFFLMWGMWWFANIVSIQIHRVQHRKDFTSRSYYHSSYLSKLPLEPLAKLVLPFIGILGELWLSHGRWRYDVVHTQLPLAFCVCIEASGCRHTEVMTLAGPDHSSSVRVQ